MPIQWTDTVLNAQAAGTWQQPNEVRVHSNDPGADGTSYLIASSNATLTWSTPGTEGPGGAMSQPATPGRSYASPFLTVSSEGKWLSFWRSGTFQGRVALQQSLTAGSTSQLNLGLVA